MREDAGDYPGAGGGDQPINYDNDFKRYLGKIEWQQFEFLVRAKVDTFDR